MKILRLTANSFQQHLYYEEMLRERGFIRLPCACFEPHPNDKCLPYKEIWKAFPPGTRAHLSSRRHIYPGDEYWVMEIYREYPVREWCLFALRFYGDEFFDLSSSQFRQFLSKDAETIKAIRVALVLEGLLGPAA